MCCYFKREQDIKCICEIENKILFLCCINSMNFLISMGRKKMVEVKSKRQCSFLHCSVQKLMGLKSCYQNASVLKLTYLLWKHLYIRDL